MLWYGNLFNIYTGRDFIQGKPTRTKLAKAKNSLVWQNVFSQLFTDALNRYEIKRLPETCSHLVCMMSLAIYGSMCFFEKENNLLCLPCAPTGDGFNIYGDPAKAWVFSANGKLNEEYKLYLHGSSEAAFLKQTTSGRQSGEAKGVFIRENALLYPFINHVFYYTDCIADSLRTLDISRHNLKKPYLITAEESVVPTVEAFLKKYDENEDSIVNTGIFDVNKLKVLPLNANNENIKSVTALCDWYYNKYKELCGVKNNSNIDKKGENLLSEEITVNEEYTEGSVEKCLEYIQLGLDDVNKLFGTDMQVVAKEQEENANEDIFRDSSDDRKSLPGDSIGSDESNNI